MKTRNQFLTVIFCLGFTTLASAQTNFIPLERGEAVEREERLMFSPGVQLSGDYRFRSSLINSKQLPKNFSGRNTSDEFSFDHDVRFTLQSSVHRSISLNLELTTEQDPIYMADLRKNRGNRSLEPDSQSANIGARRAFLELKTKPKDRTRIGKQEVNIGDRRGKIFSGVLSGFTQRCMVGTWCYDFGAMKLSTADGDWLYFLSLDYAFWNEQDQEGNSIDFFRTEIFRIKYTEYDIPLGKNNVPAKRLSESTFSKLEDSNSGFKSNGTCRSELSNYTVNSYCKPIYIYAHEQEYYGLRLAYKTPALEIYGDIVGTLGNRKYYVYDSRHKLSGEKVNGFASEFEFTYILGESRFSFINMIARGDKQIEDPNNEGLNYKRSLKGYYEIMPGTYRGTQFYFNGSSVDLNSGTGLGHSINNTRMLGFRLKYDLPESEIVYQGGIYQLKRSESVINLTGNYVKDIGLEFDNILSFHIANHAVMEVDMNIFSPGKAFSYDDHTPPGLATEIFVHLATRLFYSF